MDRRTIVQTLGASTLFGFSGCAGIANQYESGPDGSASSTPTSTPPSGSSATPEPTDRQTSNDQTGRTPDGGATEYSATTPDGPVATATVPANPSDYPYATMGSGSAPVDVAFYGSWKCPYTQEFVASQFGQLVEEYVQTGEVSVTFRALGYKDGSPFLGPDAPRATRAGLAVWNADPESFWRYFATVFASQPPEEVDWATTAQLMAFMESAGVSDLQQIRSAIESNARSSRVRATTEAAATRNVDAVPRLVIDGDVYAPNLEWDNARDVLDAAVDDAQQPSFNSLS